jgi:elongator complex protein 3
MLRLGATRVELGVQSVYNDVLKAIHRGHGVEESIAATKLLKDLGFKINYHMMPGLPGVDYGRDLAGLKEIFANQNYRPDMLKIYPCMVMKGTKLYDLWKAGKFTPLSTQNAAKLIAEFKKSVPAYCRIQRVQRDIPSYMASAGVDRTNLRQIVEKEMEAQNIRCRCIRCREAGHVYAKHSKRPHLASVKLVANGYEASDGVEWFISFEDVKQDILLGFCRLRIPSSDSVNLRKEITKDAALIRELHVVGEAVEIGKGNSAIKGVGANFQHVGLGKALLKEAEKIAKLHRKNKMVVISAIGARDYYRKFGYKLEGVYMVKNMAKRI